VNLAHPHGPSPIRIVRLTPSTTPGLVTASCRCARVFAPWPAAGPTLAFFQLLLGAADAACSGRLLLGIFDPADELVAGQRRDVLPGIECRGVGDQRLAQVSWKLVYHPAGHSRAAHGTTVVGSAQPYRPTSAARMAPPPAFSEGPRQAGRRSGCSPRSARRRGIRGWQVVPTVGGHDRSRPARSTSNSPASLRISRYSW